MNIIAKKILHRRIRRGRIELVQKYLLGLNGIEIGASRKSFGLESQLGSYANIDIIDAETRAKSKGWKKSKLVNFLASGDDLPFKDETLDYVFSSHVVEHFFDPIKAIEEWYRVVRPGGYIAMIIPHKDRTFDRNRELTPVNELLDRYHNRVGITDYARRTKAGKLKHENETDKDHHQLLDKNAEVEDGWERFTDYDFVHHWSVWNLQSFLEVCDQMKWNVIETVDTGIQIDSEFAVILKK